MIWRALFSVLAVAVLIGAAPPDQPREAAQPLRLCADPTNPPFSSASEEAAKTGMPGLYIEIGQAVADALGRPMETVWSLSYFEKRNLRTTMLAGKCDFAVGLPATDDFMGPAVIFSRPILSVGYAIAAPKGVHLASLSDLDGKRVAVQFATNPQSLIATRDAITASTVMDPEEGMRLLAKGRVDAAFVWGPSAGYDNHWSLHDTFQVIPVDGESMRFDAAIGFARKQKGLRDQVDAVLPQLAPRIAELEAKYAFPRGPAVRLAAADTQAPATDTAGTPSPATPPAAPAPTPTPPSAPEPASGGSGAGGPAAAPASAADVAAGRDIFNSTCAHCHGPDAVQSVRRIDLRLLHQRYGDDMQNVFHTTVINGRPAKGMPSWKDVFSEEDFKKIFAFLSTVQEP